MQAFVSCFQTKSTSQCIVTDRCLPLWVICQFPFVLKLYKGLPWLGYFDINKSQYWESKVRSVFWRAWKNGKNSIVQHPQFSTRTSELPPRHLVSLQIGFIHYFTLTRIQCEKREHLFHFRCRDIKLYVQFVSKNEFMKRYETRHCILVRFISRRSHSEVVFNSRYCFHRYVKKCVYHNVKKMPLTLT